MEKIGLPNSQMLRNCLKAEREHSLLPPQPLPVRQLDLMPPLLIDTQPRRGRYQGCLPLSAPATILSKGGHFLIVNMFFSLPRKWW